MFHAIETSEHFTWEHKLFEHEYMYISILNVCALKQENANNQCGIFTYPIKSKKVKRKMESNITKILIKKILEKTCDSPLE